MVADQRHIVSKIFVQDFPGFHSAGTHDNNGLYYYKKGKHFLFKELIIHQVERLHHQCNQDKKTITAQTEQITLLRKQNENLSEELEEKVKRLNDIEVS